MPHHELHRTQRSKNITLALVLVAVIVLLFAVTLVKYGNG